MGDIINGWPLKIMVFSNCQKNKLKKVEHPERKGQINAKTLNDM